MKKKTLNSRERQGLVIILAVLLVVAGIAVGLYRSATPTPTALPALERDTVIVIQEDSTSYHKKGHKRSKRKRSRDDSDSTYSSSSRRGRHSRRSSSRRSHSSAPQAPVRDILADTVARRQP